MDSNNIEKEEKLNNTNIIEAPNIQTTPSIKLSVRQLVEFNYMGGDINTKSMSPDRALEGIKAHKILQTEMVVKGLNYQKEFFLKHEFEYNNILFYIEGRADGIIEDNDFVIVDEIKSTYLNLDSIMDDHNLAHIAQAKVYAYIYSLQHELKNINVQLRYYNLDSNKTKTFTYELTFEYLELFFYDLLDGYIDYANTIILLNEQRKETINELKFPFDNYRSGQRNFSVAVYKTIKEGKKLFVEAPTGVGKTVSVLFPAIKALNLKENSKIYYLTAKSSTKSIAFKTMKMMINKGLNLRSVVITAKEKICFKEEKNCDPEFCEYARGYYDKLNKVLLNVIKNDCLFDKDFIEKIALQNEMCPFELSLDLSYLSDIVICDYNYCFDPKVSLQREDYTNNNNILLIDEAHNLEDRSRNMYSPEITKEEFWELNKLLKEKKVLTKELNNINKKFLEIKKNYSETSILSEEPKELISSLRKFVEEAEVYLSEKENLNIKKEEIPDELTDLYFKSIFFIKISEIADKNFCYYVDYMKDKFIVKLFLIDPSKILKEIEKKCWSSIFFSATLTPLKHFKYLLGGEDTDYILKLKSPFNINNLNLLVAADISMKYAVRDLNAERVCEYINALVTVKKGNYMVFFPSYAYLNTALKIYEQLYDVSNLIVHDQAISEEKQTEIVNVFLNDLSEKNNVLFTVVGGIFSEGLDLTLDKLIGAIIIGTGIPQINFERNIIRNFFDEKYNSGYDAAYKYPGWNKILQSAGRVIRTEKDKGTVLLIDSRICESSYLKLYPEHWRHYKKIYNISDLKENLINFNGGAND
jgi:Rad3-related DNA helicase